MTHKTISFGKTVNLKQALALILSNPNVRFFLRGEPGIGKSSILSELGLLLPDYNIAYLDIPTMDLGDIAMPVVNKEKMVTEFAPNARFKLQEGKPVAIMLDEFSKGVDPVKNMLHPLIEIKNPRLGDIPLPDGSIVFLTGNLSSDGVGDNMKAHSLNRLTTLTIRKPNADEWLEWATKKETISSVVMAWVNQFPHALASYTDGDQDDNPYIYNPRVVQGAYVSPRSLERASQLVLNRDKVDVESLIVALSGTIGESAARDMQAFIDYKDQLPSWESIVSNPLEAKVPESAGACAVLVFGAIQNVEKETLPAFMTYLKRFEPEWQACFVVNLAKNFAKQTMAFSSADFAAWVRDNEDIL